VQVAPLVRAVRGRRVELLDEAVADPGQFGHAERAAIPGQHRVHHLDRAPVADLTGVRVGHRHQGLADLAEAAVHAAGDIQVPPADLAGGVRRAHRGQIRALTGDQPGGVGLPAGPTPVQTQRGAQEHRPRGLRFRPRHHVVAAVDVPDQHQRGGVQAGLLAGQCPCCGGERGRAVRRPADVGDGPDRRVQLVQRLAQVRIGRQSGRIRSVSRHPRPRRRSNKPVGRVIRRVMRRRVGNPRNGFLLRYRLLAAPPVHDQNATTHPRQTPRPKKRHP
jgi:hypothetical protein